MLKPCNEVYEEIVAEIMSRPSVKIWPTAGMALGISRAAAFAGAKRGDIPTIPIGARRPVPTAWLRAKLGLDVQAQAA